jgi:hypothetical protein
MALAIVGAIVAGTNGIVAQVLAFLLAARKLPETQSGG